MCCHSKQLDFVGAITIARWFGSEEDKAMKLGAMDEGKRERGSQGRAALVKLDQTLFGAHYDYRLLVAINPVGRTRQVPRYTRIVIAVAQIERASCTT